MFVACGVYCFGVFLLFVFVLISVLGLLVLFGLLRDFVFAD